MSYNGIGLQTAKGSATNGYIQKNYTKTVENSYQRRLKNKQNNEKRDKLIDTIKDQELIKHEDKRKLELKVSEFRDKLEDEDKWTDKEIDEKCKEFRERLLSPKKFTNKKKEPNAQKKQVSEKVIELDY